MSQKTTKIEYMCSFCGAKKQLPNSMGRPLPGKCPRKSGDKPHTWVINRKF